MSMVRIVVTGPRSWENAAVVEKVMTKLAGRYGTARLLIIHGGAAGLDTVCDRVCKSMGIHTARVDALWATYNHSAGTIRNEVMLQLDPHLVVAFHWDLKATTGTRRCWKLAGKMGLRRKLIKVSSEVAMTSLAGWNELHREKREAREKKVARAAAERQRIEGRRETKAQKMKKVQ